MRDKYVEPTLTLVGTADEVVLGGSGFGGDFTGEMISPELEFDAD